MSEKKSNSHKGKVHKKRKVSRPSPFGSPARSSKELKFVDVSETSVVLSSTATFTLLNGLQIGDDFFNREGRKVVMVSSHLNGHIVPTEDATSTGPDYIRIMIVYDRQANGAVPSSITTILTGIDNAGTATTVAKSPFNMTNSDRFQIVMDKRFSVGVGGSITAAPGTAATALGQYLGGAQDNKVSNYRKLFLETKYQSSSNPSVVADIASGSLYLVTLSEVTIADAPCKFTFQHRLRFSDVQK